MAARARSVLADALSLPPADRATVAAELLASLDGPADEDAEAAWAAEITRRAARARSGEAPGIPWTEVRAEARRRVRRPAQ